MSLGVGTAQVSIGKRSRATARKLWRVPNSSRPRRESVMLQGIVTGCVGMRDADR